MSGPDLRYDFEFSWDSTYARAARLIAASVRPGRVLDLGAGVGELGAAVGHFGFSYIGGDLDPANVAEMVARGRAAFGLDLLSTGAREAILEAVADPAADPIVAVTALDVIEHLPDPVAAVDLIGSIVDALSPVAPPILVVSIPNVAHFDLAAKLMLGRWDVTPVGLLDSTHVALFDERRLASVFASWEEVGRSDVVLERSEQRFPDDLPVFTATTLHDFLRDVRERADARGSTYQFVRAYRRRAARQPAEGATVSDRDPAPGEAAPRPFLSVLTRTRGDRASLLDTITCLAAQHDDDFELHVLVHADDPTTVEQARSIVDAFDPSFADRVSVHHVPGGGRAAPLNAGLDAAAGTHVVVLDDDDVVTGDWVGTFKRLAAAAPGRVLRAGVVVQWMDPDGAVVGAVTPVTGFESPYPDVLDVLDTIRANRSPSCSYAVPMELVRTFGLRFDDEQRVAEDWKFQLDALRLAGAASTPEITSVYRRVRSGGSAADETEQVWVDDLGRVIEDLDRTPTLLPAGSLRRIHRLYERIEELESELGRRRPEDPPHAEHP